LYKGQKFCHHQKDKAKWNAWRFAGFEVRNSGIDVATNGRASVLVVRCLHQRTTEKITHFVDIHFTFVLAGEGELQVDGEGNFSLSEGDAFIIPPEMKYKINNASLGMELLEVSLRAPESFDV
ncbi:cupin domain-containing protein, partial [Crocinitomix catalasitica]|nr:cupin domain-containing protein [Crocinitomix catalasitica]